MAIYNFVCKDCKSVFEVMLSMNSQFGSVVVCPNCGSGNTSKKFTAPGIVYKTDGFYKTDNKGLDKK